MSVDSLLRRDSFEFDYRGRKIELKVREITFGEFAEIFAEVDSGVNLAQMQVQGKVRKTDFQVAIKMIVKAVEEMKIDGTRVELDEATVSRMPGDLVNKILEYVMAVNPLAGEGQS